MANPIRGKVARILNSREVALNIGKDQGVREGMQFDVLDPEPHQITDPETDEVIGSVNRPKVRVRVSVVEDRFCVARTFRRRTVNVGGSGLANIANFQLLEPPKWISETERLVTSERTWDDLPKPNVETGDLVAQVPDSVAEEEERALAAEG